MDEKLITALILSAYTDNVNLQFAPAFKLNTAYKVGEYVTFDGGLYQCISPVSVSYAYKFDSTKWKRVSLSERIWIGETTELATADIAPGTIIITTDDAQSIS